MLSNTLVIENPFMEDHRPLSFVRCTMKNCKLCRFSKVCNDLPGICIVLQYTAVAVLVGALGFLFVTQELLS